MNINTFTQDQTCDALSSSSIRECEHRFQYTAEYRVSPAASKAVTTSARFCLEAKISGVLSELPLLLT